MILQMATTMSNFAKPIQQFDAAIQALIVNYSEKEGLYTYEYTLNSLKT
jgi:hypothetical protein